MKQFLMMAACLVLAGCLTTTKPVFDPSNSTVAGNTPAFMAFVETWEAKLGTADSPREVADKAQRVHDLGGHVIVEEPNSDGGADYYSVALLGGRLLMCMVHDEKIQAFGERHGVTLEIDRDDDDDKSNPVPITADGEKTALHAFVIDVFSNGTLVCQSPATGVK